MILEARDQNSGDRVFLLGQLEELESWSVGQLVSWTVESEKHKA